MPENYLKCLFLIKFWHLCIYFIRLFLFGYVNVVFVTCSRDGCLRQQTGLGTERERGAGVDRKLNVSCVEKYWEKRRISSTGGLRSKGPTVIRCPVWNTKDVILPSYNSLKHNFGWSQKGSFPKPIPYSTQELALVRDHSWKIIQPPFCGE